MPRVWIVPTMTGEIDVYETSMADGMAVDMNASLLRQIRAANKQYYKFQAILDKFYLEAVEHPETVRRVR